MSSGMDAVKGRTGVDERNCHPAPKRWLICGDCLDIMAI